MIVFVFCYLNLTIVTNYVANLVASLAVSTTSLPFTTVAQLVGHKVSAAGLFIDA